MSGPIPSHGSPSHRQRSWNVLTLAGALSVVFVAATLGASPVHGLKDLQYEANYPGHDLSTNDGFAAELTLELTTEHEIYKRADSRKSIGDLKWIRERLSTKSPYPHEDRPNRPLGDVPNGYELVQIHVLNRHGTRYPSAKDSNNFKKLTEKLRNTTAPGFEWIHNWPSETWYPASKDNLLSTRGDADLYAIGSRFGTRYKKFLDTYPYDANSYEFRSSSKSRCTQSAYSFSLGFLKDRVATSSRKHNDLKTPPAQSVHIFTVPEGQDQEIAVEDSCPRWLEEVDDQPAVTRQQELYEKTFVPALVQELSTRFGASLTAKEVSTIYQLCGFEVSMYDDASTWCQMLIPAGSKGDDDKKKPDQGPGSKAEHLIKLETAADLEDYYGRGPGIPFNGELGCKLGTSLLQSMETALSKPSGSGGDGQSLFRGQLKFGHSETLMFFSSFLGLYNQTGIPLAAGMTEEQYAKREFRASVFSQFAANMAFEVYQPKNAGSSLARRHLERRAGATGTGEVQGLIRLLVNEKPVAIPGCGTGSLFCEWSKFKSYMIQRGAGCDFVTCCGVKPCSATNSKVSTGAVVFASNATCPSTAPIVA
ncbi:histidine phosphatase superfamily [Mortierella sp. GBAus27b]|nr:PHOsphatase [Mortierella sp. GBA43]KAI8358649.1 histidine phosphatase superfamily [Mortierella sp. GBAus27b]